LSPWIPSSKKSGDWKNVCGRPSSARTRKRRARQAQVVEAHRPGKGPKSTAVVTCTGRFSGPQFTGALKFMRVWLKQDGRWQIVAGSVANG